MTFFWNKKINEKSSANFHFPLQIFLDQWNEITSNWDSLGFSDFEIFVNFFSKVEISFCEELHVEARQCCWDQGSGTWPSWSLSLHYHHGSASNKPCSNFGITLQWLKVPLDLQKQQLLAVKTLIYKVVAKQRWQRPHKNNFRVHYDFWKILSKTCLKNGYLFTTQSHYERMMILLDL